MRAVTAFVVLSACVALTLANSICTLTDEATGAYYDLSKLTRTSGEDWIALDSLQDNEYNYRINICHDILYKGYNASVSIPAGTGLHQERRDKPLREHSVGKSSYYPELLDGLLIMKFVDGETCDRAKVNRMAIINFECDKNAGLGTPVFLFESSSSCTYVFEWRSSAACPSYGMSGFAIFAIVIVSLIGAYFLFGFLYMRLVVNARGWEQIPNYSFWRSIFLTLKCCGSSSSSTWTYRAVHINEEDGGNLIDNLEDDFDDDAVEKL